MGPSRCQLLFVGLLLSFAALAARADSDFERGFREGYSKGYQDGSHARPSEMVESHGNRVRGIVVIRAQYGDDRKVCDLTPWAAGHFNNRTTASVDVTNGICGDPSPGNRKSLRIEYFCNGERKIADAYEHRRLALYCH